MSDKIIKINSRTTAYFYLHQQSTHCYGLLRKTINVTTHIYLIHTFPTYVTLTLTKTHVNVLKCFFSTDNKPIPFKFIHQFLNVFVISFNLSRLQVTIFLRNISFRSRPQNNLTSLKVLLRRKAVNRTNIFNRFHLRTSNFQI